jgi:hypothetical protein
VVTLSSDAVFTPTDYPKHTYVQRDELHYEQLLQEWARSSTQIASLSGPSKAGKTVLVQRVIGVDKLITVSGASVRAPDQLWERVLDWWGEPHATTASVVETQTDAATRERGAQIGFSGTGVSHKSGTGHTSAAAETLQATVNRRGLPQVVAELANTPYTILLDDFHYIPAAIQSDVAQQLKDAASRGVRICVASVPHRTDNVVRALPELRGRVLVIDLDYWNKRDLLQIPKLGFPLMGLEVDTTALQMLASEAAGSPQLMQTICQGTCNHFGARSTLDPPRAVVLDELARKEILYLASCYIDFRALVRAMLAGPRGKTAERRTYVHRDGRTGDVYFTVLRALAMDPPRLAIELGELARRVEDMCGGGAHPDNAQIARACAALGQIASGFAAVPTSGPSLEWDDHAQTIVIPDPYLLFYLRWSVILEREADALI